jgi:hypothetical protein
LDADLFGLSSLTGPERVARLRSLAKEARRLASVNTISEHREAFARIAENWEKIADGFESVTLR